MSSEPEYNLLEKDFDNYAQRKQLTILQLKYIERYLTDFTTVINTCIEPKPDAAKPTAAVVAGKIEKKTTATELTDADRKE